MAQKVKIDELANTIVKEMQAYSTLATDVMKKAVKKAANSAKKDISSNAPKDTGAYAKSWAVKNTKETSNALELTVHSKNRYQIAHLLEKGHVTRNGGRTRAFVHIAPVEQKCIKQYEKDVERIIKNGG